MNNSLRSRRSQVFLRGVTSRSCHTMSHSVANQNRSRSQPGQVMNQSPGTRVEARRRTPRPESFAPTTRVYPHRSVPAVGNPSLCAAWGRCPKGGGGSPTHRLSLPQRGEGGALSERSELSKAGVGGAQNSVLVASPHPSSATSLTLLAPLPSPRRGRETEASCPQTEMLRYLISR